MKKLFDMELSQQDELLMENTARGDILLSSTQGGMFRGERLRGNVMPLGMCVTCTPGSGRNQIDISLALETDDESQILMNVSAHLHLEPELEQKLIEGKAVPLDEYYYKGVVKFDAGKAGYKWLEERVFVCDGVICDWSRLRFSVYEV